MNPSSLFSVNSDTDDERRVTASCDVPAATVLCRFAGPIIHYEDTKALGERESYALQVSADAYRLLDPPYRYFNHSCEPNCGLNPSLELVTIRSVNAGDELTWDYSTSMLERDWQMPCSCGKATCRKLIGDFDKLPAALQHFYTELDVVQAFILDKIGNDPQRRSVPK